MLKFSRLCSLVGAALGLFVGASVYGQSGTPPSAQPERVVAPSNAGPSVELVQESFTGTLAVAEVTLPDGMKYFVLPNEPDAPLSEALPFQHLPIYRLVPVGDKLYDPMTRTLRAQLVAESDWWRPDVVSKISTFYSNRGESVQALAKPDTVPFTARQLREYEVYLRTPWGEDILVTQGKSPGAQSGNGIPIFFTVQGTKDDARLNDALNQNPPMASIVLRMHYDTRQFKRAKVTTEQTLNAVSNAIEKIGGPGTSAVVGRQGVQELRESLISLVSQWEISSDPDLTRELRDRAGTIVSGVFDDLVKNRAVKLADLRAGDGERFAWTTANGVLELTPTQVRTLTTALETKTNFRKLLEKEWDELHTIEQKSQDYDSFHEGVVKSSGGSGGFSYGGFGISGGGGTRTNRTTDTLKVRTRYLYDQLKNSGKFRDELVDEAYKNWTGEEVKSETIAKDAAIDVVRASDVAVRLAARLVIIHESATRLASHDLVFSLGGLTGLRWPQAIECDQVAIPNEGMFKVSTDDQGHVHKMAEVRVNFARPFRSPPRVNLDLAGFDMWTVQPANSTEHAIRLTVWPINIDEKGFTARVILWHEDMRPFAVYANWIAVGER